MNVLAAFAQYERRLIAQRTRDALAVKRAQGVVPGRPRSLPRDIAEQILARRAAGETLVEIAARLTATGVPTAQEGERWHASR